MLFFAHFFTSSDKRGLSKGAFLDLNQVLETLRATRQALVDEIAASEENLKKAKKRLEKAKSELKQFDETLQGIHQPGEVKAVLSPEQILIENLRRPIKDLDLPTMALNALTNEPRPSSSLKALKYLGELVVLSEDDLGNYPGIARRSCVTIRTKLKILYGLKLEMTDLPNWREGLEENTDSP